MERLSQQLNPKGGLRGLSRLFAALLSSLILMSFLSLAPEEAQSRRRRKPSTNITQPKPLPMPAANPASMPPQDRQLAPITLQDLSQMEAFWFGHSFDELENLERISQLEDLVFGTVSSNQGLDQRYERLRSLYQDQLASIIPEPEKEPVDSSGLSKEATGLQRIDIDPETANGNSDLPISASEKRLQQEVALQKAALPDIEALEQELFGKVYHRDPFEQRLIRLEGTMFGGPVAGPLVARLEGLRQARGVDALSDNPFSDDSGFALPGPQAPADLIPTQPFGQGTPPGQPGAPTTPAPDSVNLAQLAQIEEDLFKRSYSNEPVEQRLARIEQEVFSQESPPGLSNVDRYQRLVAVTSANTKGTIKGTRRSRVIRQALPFVLTALLILL